MSVEITIALISSVVAIITLIVTSIYRSYELKVVRKAEKRKEIQGRLDEFYGPIISYLNVVRALYDLFKVDKPKDFRTLTYLLNPEQKYQSEDGMVRVTLSDVDKKLLEEIMDAEKKIEDLIFTKSGLIDNDRLTFDYTSDLPVLDANLCNTSLIAAALSHFRLLRMAYYKEISGDATRFEAFVYPREFDDEIKQEIKFLRNELKKLK